MTPYVSDPDFQLWHGDVRDVLPTLPAASVDCALTSPPFYALRDYGVQGQIGLEATPDEWVAELVAVFRELRRVLKPAGTLWIECGDSYSGSGPSGASYQSETTKRRAGEKQEGSFRISQTLGERGLTYAEKKPIPVAGTKAKDLIGAPWQLAFALRADGWYLRQCIVWAKPNAMPESVRDRCTTAHSYLFLLSKSPRYWFDADAISEPAEWARWGDQTVPKYEGTETASGWMQPRTKGDLTQRRTKHYNTAERYGLDNGGNSGLDALAEKMRNGEHRGKNARSVWTIPTSGFSEAHFATFPEALVERIIKAGCPEWVCGTCGKARERIVERTPAAVLAPGSNYGNGAGRNDGGRSQLVGASAETVGWSDCGCQLACSCGGIDAVPGTTDHLRDCAIWDSTYRPGVVLDPFMGSGTTALVARRLGRRSVGIELNASYCEMAARRLSQLSLLAEGVA